ncbi:MAG: sulfatase-like hydrolase/transferase [Verrucomicrobiota bacterium]
MSALHSVTQNENGNLNSKSKWNVVCIIADDTDPFNLGCYGGDDFLTPHLDQLAAEGMAFMKAEVVAPVCTPSRWCYLTGKYPGRCQGRHFLETNPRDDLYNITWNTDLQPDEENLATVLRDSGYTTGYVGKFHAGRRSDELGLQHLSFGHDPRSSQSSHALSSNQEKILAEMKQLGWDDPRRVTWGNLDFESSHNITTHNLEWTTEGALQFLEDHCQDTKPFCLYYGLHTIHGPKHGENLPELDPLITAAGPVSKIPDADMPSRQSVLDRLNQAGLDPYHRNVGALWMDDAIGAILRKVDSLGLRDNTIVIFKSDHGKFTKATLFDAGARIPMIWRWPGKIKEGSKCHQTVQNIDFMPTLLDALGISIADKYELDGLSYRYMLEGVVKPLREYFYNEMGMARSIHNQRWKFVALRYKKSVINQLISGGERALPNHIGTDCGDGTAFQRRDFFCPDQLYEIQQDRYENINLASVDDYSEILEMMKLKLSEVLCTFDHPFPLNPHPFQKTELYGLMAEKAIASNKECLGAGSFFGDRYW